MQAAVIQSMDSKENIVDTHEGLSVMSMLPDGFDLRKDFLRLFHLAIVIEVFHGLFLCINGSLVPSE